MLTLPLHDYHASNGAVFLEWNGVEAVRNYGDFAKEHGFLNATAGVIDLTCRSRLCLTGPDRIRFLNGQVTNNVADLKVGTGCFAALVTAKGKMQSDLTIYCLDNELLLDFEPGLSQTVLERLDKYIIADDVQVVDVAPHFGLLSVQGPKAAVVVSNTFPGLTIPPDPLSYAPVDHSVFGEIYVMRNARSGTEGFDIFAGVNVLQDIAEHLLPSMNAVGGGWVGIESLEMARIEATIPRYGTDIDETNLAPEAGLEATAINYRKGCYIGQEVIARIRTYGQVAKALRGLAFSDQTPLPKRGDKLWRLGKEVGYVTSSVASLRYGKPIGFGYVRKECHGIGTDLSLRVDGAEHPVRVASLPFSNVWSF